MFTLFLRNSLTIETVKHLLNALISYPLPFSSLSKQLISPPKPGRHQLFVITPIPFHKLTHTIFDRCLRSEFHITLKSGSIGMRRWDITCLDVKISPFRLLSQSSFQSFNISYEFHGHGITDIEKLIRSG